MLPDVVHSIVGPPGRPVICFVTGLGGVRANFAPQVRFLKNRFRVLTFDHPGLGGSPDWTEKHQPITMDSFAALVVRLGQQLQLPSMHLVGMSFGGKVALTVALKAPALVHSLTLSGTSIADNHTPTRLQSLRTLAELLSSSESQKSMEERAAKIGPVLFGPKYLETHPERVRALVRWRDRHPPNRHAIQMQKLANNTCNISGRLGAIQCPVQILQGDTDALCSPSHASYLAQHIPNAAIHWFERVGHSPNVECPRAFSEAIEHFVDRHSHVPSP